MKILAVDDEKNALGALECALQRALPDAEVYAFRTGAETLDFAKTTPCDVAFLDIAMRDMDGMELAKRLKALHGDTNIIFVTGYTDYALDAFSLYVSGYMLKPVTAEKVLAAMEHLRHPVTHAVPQKRIKVRTFGNFEAFVDGMPVHFTRSKAKELLAYLIDRNGALCTVKELAAVLFEDRPYDISAKNQIQTFTSALLKTFAAIGEEDIIIKRHNAIAVNTALLDCDYYRFLQRDAEAINSYAGEYMRQYSWADFRNADIEERLRKK